MSAQARVDQFLNLLKLLVSSYLTVLLIRRFLEIDGARVWTAMFPSLATMKQNLGWLGLTTNILFNLAWQFDDKSSWHSVIAG